MAASPAIALGGLVLVSAWRPGALAAAAPCSRCGPSRRSSRTGSRSRSRAGRRARAGGPAVPPRGGPRDLEVLRGVHGPGGPRAARGQRPGGPDARIAHRTSPTNIGMGLLSTLAAHDLGFITTGRARRADRRDAHHDGGSRADRGAPLQLVRHASLAPLPPRYVSTVDSGNLAGALIAVSEGLAQLGRAPRRRSRARAMPARGSRACRGAPPRSPDEMSFGFLYDRQRSLFSIGYRVADAEGPGRLDPSHYDLLASEARLASFIAIAKGDVPEKHWFHLGRAVTSVRGNPTLLSWSATLFEYLMPLLVMRSYPDTLLDEACRMAVRRQRDYGAERAGAVGDLGVRLRRRRSPRQLPVQGLRRPRARHEARPRRRAGGRALRDRARRARRPNRGGGEPPPPRAGGAARRVRLLRRGRLHAAADEEPTGACRPARPPAGRRDRLDVPRPSPGDDARGDRGRAHRQPDGGALPLGPARAGDGAAPPGARAAPRAAHPLARTRRCASRRRCRPRRSATCARRTPRSRTRSSCRTATTPSW